MLVVRFGSEADGSLLAFCNQCVQYLHSQADTGGASYPPGADSAVAGSAATFLLCSLC